MRPRIVGWCKSIDTYRNNKAVFPAKILRNISPNQRSCVCTIGHEEAIDPHIKPALMKTVQVTDRSTSNGHRTTKPQPVNGSCHKKSVPCSAISSNNVTNTRKQISQNVDRPAAIDTRKRDEEERANSRKYDVDG